MNTYSRKQAGVIYRAVKEGKIELTKDEVSASYDYSGSVEVFNNTAANHVENIIAAVRGAIDAIFDNDYTLAQNYLTNAF